MYSYFNGLRSLLQYPVLKARDNMTVNKCNRGKMVKVGNAQEMAQSEENSTLKTKAGTILN